MNPIAIRAEGLSKLYHLGGGARSALMKDVARDALHGIYQRLRGARPSRERDVAGAGLLWALRDVSFELKRGEVVGILGHNGAGKSVLLKILSRITAPTAGRAEIYGRIGSLIEIGTGFHPELSGRENVYLNGAILGMSRREVVERFDEIVAFAGLERFIDTPVKHYSSGMTVRLAFAVAAHLDAETVLLDEVWAAGDADFQTKSLAKMHELIGGGRTVVMVSHNLEQILSLCGRALLLDHGRLIADGKARDVVRRYSELDTRLEAAGPTLKDLPRFYERRVWEATHAPGNDRLRLLEVSVRNPEGKACRSFGPGEPIEIQLGLDIGDPTEPVALALAVVDAMNRAYLLVTNVPGEGAGLARRPEPVPNAGRHRVSFVIPAGDLPPTDYRMSVFAGTPGTLLNVRDISAEDVIFWRVTSTLGAAQTVPRQGVLHLPGVWEPC